ncbi:condensation domain-containing protein [Micromonospora sp. NPDC049836]|uniref:condensation domain-containing protein n=1 Tax=Micromonospora sp. NPDC049836 TaxID=3364274 RepID=UPI0037934E2C
MTQNLHPDLADLTPEQRELLALRLRRARGRRADPGAPRPLSATQEQLWFLDRLDPGTPVYNVPFAERITGRLDVPALHRAVNAVVARHDALRVVFTDADGTVTQRVRDALEVPLPVVDLRALPDPDRRAAAGRETVAHAAVRFDLTAGPLLAVRLLALADDEHLLLVTVHHIVFDAWSAGLFRDELVRWYGEFAGAEPARVPALPVRFVDHVAARRRPDGEAALAAHLAHWRERLADAPARSTLPPDRPRPPVQTHRGRSLPFTVDGPTVAALDGLARRAGATVNAVALAGLAALLRQATGQDDLLLGMPAAGRSGTELEALIGCFANMLVLRVDATGDPTVRDLVRRVHGTVSEAYAHQEAPYARVVEEVRPARDPSVNPLFQVMATMTDGDATDRRAAGAVFTPYPAENGLTDFDLFVSLTRHADRIDGAVDFNADLYLDETVAGTVGRLPELLAAMAAAPDRPLSELPGLRRHRIALAATFTVDPLRDPVRFWLDFLRTPADVDLVGYGQLVAHLLAGPAAAATVGLLRWEDWLRRQDGPDEAALDAAMDDLTGAVRAYRARTAAPLLLVVCPASPAFADARARALSGRLDDRLSALAAGIPGVRAVWAADQAGRYPVGEVCDVRADELGHVPYTAEYFAALGTVVVRELRRAAGQPGRLVLADATRLPVDRIAGALTGHEVRACPPGGYAAALADADPARAVALDPDPATVAGLRAAYPELLALTVPAGWDELRPYLAHVWALDPPLPTATAGAPAAGGPGGADLDGPGAGRATADSLLTPIGAERAAYLATELDSPAAVAERCRPAAAPEPAGAELVAPRTPTERRLAGLWAAALGAEQVGVTSDFFALGGHSLLATHLLSQVQAEFGREVSLYTLFTHPTVAQLATVLDGDAAQPADHAPITAAPPGTPAVPSSAQVRLWALDQLGDDVVRHNTTAAVELRGDLDADALRRALADVVARHEVLRTTFRDRGGEPEPVVHAHLDPWQEPLDLTALPDARQARALRRAVTAHAAHRYDLAAGPLLLARLVRLAPQRHQLLLGMHHIVCDNTSWSIVLADLAARYARHRTGAGGELPPLPVQFADYARHQRDWLASAAVEPHLAYWRERLRDAPPLLALPTDHPRPEERSDVAGYRSQRLPAGVGAAVRELARAEGVTPFAVLLAGFAALLHAESGQPDLVLGVPTAGRDRAELAGLVGCFADLLPLRVDVAGRPTFRQLVGRAYRSAREAYRHQGVPFATVVEALRLPRQTAYHPLFQCVLNVIDGADELPEFAGLAAAPVDVPSVGVDFDLFLSLTWQDGELHADLAYSADLFTPERMARLLGALGRVLDEGLRRPDAPIAGPATAAPARPATRPAPRLVVGGTVEAPELAPTVRFWSELLGVPYAVRPLPAGALLRLLRDPAAGLAAAATDRNALLLRWEDRIPAGPLGAAVLALRAYRAELASALAAYRGWSAAPLTLLVCPATPRFAGAPWAGVLAELTAGLRASRPASGVDVVAVPAWAHHYRVPVPDRADGCSPELSAVLGTLLVRRALRHPAVDRLVVPAGPAQRQAELAAVLAAQARAGRRVLLTTAPQAPELAALVAAGLVGVDPAPAAAPGTLLLHPATEPGPADPLAVPFDPQDGPAAVLRGLWLLDRPPGDTPAGDATPVDPGLLAEVAVELADAGAIRAAVADGYRRRAERAAAAPRTERERQLVAIWSDLLRTGGLGIHDDFFAAGGDSLLAMQLVARCAEAGITVTPRQLVRHPTVAELAASLGAATAVDAEQGEVTGEAPLTGAQRWFTDLIAPTMGRPALFNHPYYLRLARPLPADLLRAAVRRLVAQHDALRLRLTRRPDGSWRQHHADPADAVPFTSHDLTGLPVAEREAAAEARCAAEQTGLDLTAGPLARVAHLRLGPELPDRLLIVAHHLVVDAVSRGLLLADLETLCGQLERGEAPVLPAKTTSYRAWAERLAGYAGSARLREQLPFWLAQTGDGGLTRLADVPHDGPYRLGDLGLASVTLDAAATRGLHAAARRLRTGVRDLLVWAAASTVAARTGGPVTVATTGHGREPLFDDVDTTRTAGWFQVLYPLRLELPAAGPATRSLRAVIRQLGRVPDNGIGYGLLRHLCPDEPVRRQLAAIRPPAIAVNYMGGFGFDDVSPGSQLLDVCPAPFGPTEDPDGHWPFPFDVTGALTGDGLRLDLSYATPAFRPETADDLLDGIRTSLLRLVGDHGQPPRQ